MMELEVDGHCALLVLFLSRVLKIIVFYHREWQRSRQELDACQKLLIVDPCHLDYTRMNLSAFPIPGAPL
jgi:hypothetical protein